MPSPTLFSVVFLRLIIVNVALLLVACGDEVKQAQGGFPPPAVSVAEVVVQEITPREMFTGRIEAQESVQIRPRVGGVIEVVHYREGAIVKKGDLLFSLDSKPFRAELERAEAELERTRAQAELARVESQRAKTVFEQTHISRNEYDRRIAATAQADATVRSMRATVQLAKLSLEYTEIRAPISGRTGRAFLTKGNLVAADPNPDVLTTLVSLNPVYIYFESDEQTYLSYSNAVRQTSGASESSVLVGLGNEEGYPHKGKIDFIDNRVNPATGTIRLRAVLDNKGHQLIPGLFARVQLLAPTQEQALLIDDKAILTDQDRKYIYVLGPDNTAQRRDIKIDQTVAGLRQVTEGLQAGDQVIVHGIQKIFFPGMPVSPQQIAMGDPPPAQPASGH